MGVDLVRRREVVEDGDLDLGHEVAVEVRDMGAISQGEFDEKKNVFMARI